MNHEQKKREVQFHCEYKLKKKLIIPVISLIYIISDFDFLKLCSNQFYFEY